MRLKQKNEWKVELINIALVQKWTRALKAVLILLSPKIVGKGQDCLPAPNPVHRLSPVWKTQNLLVCFSYAPCRA